MRKKKKKKKRLARARRMKDLDHGCYCEANTEKDVLDATTLVLFFSFFSVSVCSTPT